ncbi:50S ribosomal protein L17 [Orientia tsutsugamushi]|uniref:Large ribosomal subunit protein bL17 n=4 Tax=Orientia tsutsugamushi TaxID=784 RepID=RL17_ORITI|nr:50S ribosomal protein L17 [Orientia tsutsugamushi]B3CT30.1 RecName: Full=Large ribosomal subunit protein bL17; AltName: Full=50S ribosomal protein L17 [Orientia tsutsugamushi str. Ikeda]KJV51637.1 ribosomal protein L17 [Orientia tsutsugamushi str. Gilliam]KJV56863.1 ribosomal protein L17 [Orientia tsutsugamushi str. Kato PP]KJW07788.1 ribosomal protein L17 [Orientia tsutsugamushi str. UT144]SPM46291.1 50S ribosomal protein L17 [Orientia tsutsugamushi]SPR11966.1 50S ribosomal protein L17 [O
MRHRVSGRKLNRTTSHLLAMLANMSVSLIQHEQINTTLPKAKELRPFVEKLITVAKKGNLNARRYLISKIKNELAVEKLMTTLAPRYAERHGGYIRILKAGFRYGDMAPMAYIEFVDRNIESKGKEFKALKNDSRNAKLIAEQSN